MSAEYRRAMARCDSMQRLLTSLRSSPHFHKHAVNQAMCLTNLLKDVSLTDDEVAEFVTRITEVGFPQDVEAQLVDSLTACADTPDRHVVPTTRCRQKNTRLQNFETFWSYFPESIWREMSAGSPSDIIRTLVQTLLRLGLRHPSEPTYGMMSCIFCILLEGEDATFEKEKKDKHGITEHVKDVYKRMVATWPDPGAYVVVLPDTVSQFVAKYPALASEFYGGQSPGLPPMDTRKVQSMAACWPLRKPRAAPAQSLATPESQVDMMKAFMNSMMNMAQAQFAYRERDPLLTIHGSRPSFKSLVDRGPLPLTNGDAVPERGLARLPSEGSFGSTTAAALALPEGSVALPTFDARLRSTTVAASADQQVIDASAAAAGDLDPEKGMDASAAAATSGVLGSLLGRESEKAAAKRVEVLKRPAAKAAPKGKQKGATLGCSKCRYLKNGCGACRDKALRKKR